LPSKPSKVLKVQYLFRNILHLLTLVEALFNCPPMNDSDFSKKKLTRKLEDLKPVLAKKYKVKHIGYFGSYASGDETESSDIDILVEFEEPLGWKFFELKDFLEEHLAKPVDLVTRNALKEQLRESILSNTIYV
jgi:predicted nucleotidyltransferase